MGNVVVKSTTGTPYHPNHPSGIVYCCFGEAKENFDAKDAAEGTAISFRKLETANQ